MVVIPREEEPQISVPMVDIRVNADGLRGPDAVELVTKPLEAIVKGIDGVEHVYSQTEDDRVMVTARFLVGTKSEDAILRVHEKIRANLDRIPVGIPEPLIVGRGINDVAVTVLTLSPKPEAAERWTDKDLYELADKLRAELMKVDSIGLTYISGGAAQQIRVEPDPEKLSLFGVTLQQLVAKVKDANRSFLAGQVRDAGIVRSVAAGQTLSGIPDIGLLLISTRDGRPVYVKDVASVVIGPNTTEHRVWNDARDGKGNWERVPAVSLALAKRAGANAVVVSEEIAHRLEGLKSRLIPGDVEVTVTRDYGETANEKANELLFHLGLATISIVGPDRDRDRLARGAGHAGRDPDHDPADAVCRQSDGLHHQPRQPVRADLLDRHPGRRRHRRGREHRPPLGDAGRPAARAGHHRGRRRGRQSDRRGDADRGRRVAADAVRVGADGPLYGADPGQCVGGHAVLVLRRHGGGALADAAAGAEGGRRRRRSRRARRRRARAHLPALRNPDRRAASARPGYS